MDCSYTFDRFHQKEQKITLPSPRQEKKYVWFPFLTHTNKGGHPNLPYLRLSQDSVGSAVRQSEAAAIRV